MDAGPKTHDPWSLQHAAGCLRILLLPAFLVLAFITLKVEGLPWLTYTTCGIGLVLFIFWASLIFTVPEKTAEGLVGGSPKVIPGIPEAVSKHATRLGLIQAGETLLAAIDDSWTGNGSKGLVVTDRRLLQYREGDLRLEVPFPGVQSVFIRAMWYPGVGILGRGEIVGQGSVIVLRLRFRMADGTTRKLRLSQFASDLYPFLSAMLAKLGDRVEVGRTMPGI